MPPARRRHWWRIVVAMAVVLVFGATGFLVVPYVFRTHPGPMPLGAAVKAFKGNDSSTSDGSIGYDPPAQGVYALSGQGTERISFPPNSQRDGAVMPASVTYLADGCWRWHVDYNVAHWEEYDFCPRGTQLQLVADRISQSWDFGTFTINNLARLTCPPGTVVLPEDPKSDQTLGVVLYGDQHHGGRAQCRGDDRTHCRDRHPGDRGQARPHHP